MLYLVKYTPLFNRGWRGSSAMRSTQDSFPRRLQTLGPLAVDFSTTMMPSRELKEKI